MRYIGFDESIDENYVWVVNEFKSEPLPQHFFQYVKDGMVYWVDGRTQEATWKHPLYDKYKRMLQVARVQKPLFHWKSVMQFRIEFLISGIFTWEVEATGEYPPIETVDNVIEMARIFQADIRKEPYFVHVLKLALRHYAEVVKEKRPVKNVDDFRALMVRYRNLVSQFERAKNEEVMKTKKLKVCVQCPEAA